MGMDGGACAWNLIIFLELRTCCICANLRKYQCYICSSHSYNHNLTSGPLGPRQIVNYSGTFTFTSTGLIFVC